MWPICLKFLLGHYAEKQDFFAPGFSGDGRACFLPSHGKIGKSGDSASWAQLQPGVSLGKCGLLAEVQAGGKWKLQLCSGAFFSPIFSDPSSSWQNLPPSVVRGWSSTGAMAGFGRLALKLCYCCPSLAWSLAALVLCCLGFVDGWGPQGESTQELEKQSRRVGEIWVIAGCAEFKLLLRWL